MRHAVTAYTNNDWIIHYLELHFLNFISPVYVDTTAWVKKLMQLLRCL